MILNREPWLAQRGADIIHAAFRAYQSRFQALTRLAGRRFERREWSAAQHDAVERLDLYSRVVGEALAELGGVLGERIHHRPVWTALRAAYASRIRPRGDVELAETFFNSLTRRIFHTVGVDPTVEFVAPEWADHDRGWTSAVTVTFARSGPVDELVRRVLEHFRLEPGYEDEDRDVRRIAAALAERLPGRPPRALELARSVFYRNKGAYLVGRLVTDDGAFPLVIALVNDTGRIEADAVLVDENEVSIVFSFARSYFCVEMERPRELVDFLRAIMPRKPAAELYNAVGLNKHGKTELFRSLLRHLEATDDRFEIAPGQRGMVMCVFTLPGFDVVFKVIRDRFEYPKTVTHDEVREKYRLVFRHDRAGRLVDAQEFEHLEFDRRRFSDALLRELSSLASETVTIKAGTVVIRHLYTERRLTPLDVFLRDADPDAARHAVVDYGQVLRDLAATNIFPGDMLLKNFGVSRHGRLIFYDYDELCLLTDCNFRELPPPRDDGEESAGEPWFYVGERDIFPEEFRSFLGLRGELLEAFLEAHEELLHVGFWHRMQDKHRHGEVLDIFPYRASRRLEPGGAARDGGIHS